MGMVLTWDGKKMLNPLLQSHPVFIAMQSLVIIWDFSPPWRDGFNSKLPKLMRFISGRS